jgi:hypothetical protein
MLGIWEAGKLVSRTPLMKPHHPLIFSASVLSYQIHANHLNNTRYTLLFRNRLPRMVIENPQFQAEDSRPLGAAMPAGRMN